MITNNKLIFNKNDLFNILLQNKFKKIKKDYIAYTYIDNEIKNKKDYNLLKALITTFDKSENDIAFINKKTLYKIYDITYNFKHIISIISSRQIFKKIYNDKDILYDKKVYLLDDNISRKYLDTILNIYYGIDIKNCCILFQLSNKQFCLSKSFSNFTYRKNEKGKMCLFINNEYWEY